MNPNEQYCIVRRAVTHPKNSQYHIDTPKSKRSGRTVLLSSPLVDILKLLEKPEGFLFGGRQPWCYSHVRRTFSRAKKALGLSGYNNHDFRTTFATQLVESGLSSKECADLLGHADTRMVERVYARTRHEGNLKHLEAVEKLNRTAII